VKVGQKLVAPPLGEPFRGTQFFTWFSWGDREDQDFEKAGDKPVSPPLGGAISRISIFA
jgi:hypothetical protein